MGSYLRGRLAIAAGTAGLLAAGFFGLDYHLAGGAFHDVATALDARVPFRPEWVWAYLLYYPFCFLPLAMPGVLAEERLFKRVAAGYIAQSAAAWVLFYFYPTAMRHPAIVGHSLNESLLEIIRAVDPGYNIFPSLHVANAVFVWRLASRLMPSPWPALCAPPAALIAASTVLVKQHYLLDLPAGALLGWAAAWAALRGWTSRAAVSAPPAKPLAKPDREP
ncbi:MAG: phosphatase PAP2 family protein [Elusimicrobiota bacterium]